MLKSLYLKLTLAFMVIAITTAALVAIFIRTTSENRLSQLVIDQQRNALVQSLSSYYAANGSWNGISSYWRQFQVQLFPTSQLQSKNPPNPNSQNEPGQHNPLNQFGLADASGKVLISVDPHAPDGTQLSPGAISAGTVIMVNGKRVGTVLVASQPPGFNQAETQFLNRTNQALFLAVLVALIAALIMGVILARTLTRPLRDLTKAAQSIAHGNLEQEVKVSSKDEIGQLATSFNSMSQEVARVNQLRKQMTADIAHDLRTPLTVIGGYVESMRDGVLSPTHERLSLIYTEIERLQSLVADLRMLSQVDAGELPLNPQPISPETLLNQSCALFQHHAQQHGVALMVKANPQLPNITVDEGRMMQVMDNLISNALRYTPQDGQIWLIAQKPQEEVELIVKDTGPGINPDDLPNIFDRFYRADKSRHSEASESGLGLAIVKALVEAQKGQVWAESSLGKGTSIVMKFSPATMVDVKPA